MRALNSFENICVGLAQSHLPGKNSSGSQRSLRDKQVRCGRLRPPLDVSGAHSPLSGKPRGRRYDKDSGLSRFGAGVPPEPGGL